jgi:hypothetical protein
MQLTMSARKSESKLRVVREMGLGQPKKWAKKVHFFAFCTENTKKWNSGAVKLRHFKRFLRIFCMHSFERMPWGPFLSQPDLKTHKRRDFTKW